MRILQASKKRKVLLKIDDFSKGTNTLIDDARLSTKMAKESKNLWQEQDGRWAVRPGTAQYGAAISGESSLDGIGEFVTSAGVKELIAVGGTTGKIFKSTNDAASWAQLGSITLTAGHMANFLQIRSVFYISNGVDNMVVYDGTVTTQYTEMDPPAWAATPIARTGLTDGGNTYYYQVTALNDVGETIGNAEEDITTNKLREQWDTSNYLTLTWVAVAGATQYQVYVSNTPGTEVLLGATNAVSFVDNGSAVPNPYQESPLDNTTTAPKLVNMTISGNRMWGIDADGKIWFGGTGQFTRYFSPFFGGGYIYIEKGGRETPKAVRHFKTGSGAGIATVFTSDPSGSGSVWQISLDVVTVADTSFVVPVPTKVIVGIGTQSNKGVITSEKDILAMSKNAYHSLLIKPQLYNILSSNELSLSIRPSWRNLISHEYDNGIYWNNLFLMSVSMSSRNDITTVYDTERNCPIWYWSIGAKQFLLHTTSDGTTKLLTVPVSGGYIVEWSEEFTNDMGATIPTSYISGLIQMDKDMRNAVRMKNTIVEFGRLRGTITIEVLGQDKTKGLIQLASKTLVTDSLSDVDITEALLDDIWPDDPITAPTSFAQASTRKSIRTNKPVYAVQYRIRSDSINTKYAILSIQSDGVLSSNKIPNEWTN